MPVDARVLALLDAVPEPILIADADGGIRVANRTATRLLGYSTDDIVGMPVKAILPEFNVSTFDVSDASPVVRGDGAPLAADVGAAALPDGDIAVVIRHPPRVQEWERLGQLAGGAAHDFNNLLGVIVNYAAFAAEEIASAVETDPARWSAVATDVEQVRRAAERGMSLTDRLLAFALRSAGPRRLVSVNAVIAGLPLALGDRIELRTELAEDLRPVRADPTQLERVLAELVDNARDAMPDGGVLSVSTGNGPGGREVRVRVGDTGDGMPPEVLAHAVEPFFTARPKGSRVGLGLTIVEGIVSEYGGDVRIASEPGAGTRVTLLIPAVGF
jgi:signal transduction histidine kinase